MVVSHHSVFVQIKRCAHTHRHTHRHTHTDTDTHTDTHTEARRQTSIEAGNVVKEEGLASTTTKDVEFSANGSEAVVAPALRGVGGLNGLPAHGLEIELVQVVLCHAVLKPAKDKERCAHDIGRVVQARCRCCARCLGLDGKQNKN